MPYKKIGPARNANEHAALSLEVKAQTAQLRCLCILAAQRTRQLTCQARISIRNNSARSGTVLTEALTLAPGYGHRT